MNDHERAEKQKFNIGSLFVTKGIYDRMMQDQSFSKFVAACLGRHRTGDWGDLDAEDIALNEEALMNGNDRLFSAYIRQSDGIKIWVITEADRSRTTVLFPNE